MSRAMSSVRLSLITFAAVAVGLGLAQVTAPAPATHKLSDQSRVELVNAYMKALMYSNDVTKRQRELCDTDVECKSRIAATNQAVNEYNLVVGEVIKREGLPAGTGFTVESNTGQVTVRLANGQVPVLDKPHEGAGAGDVGSKQPLSKPEPKKP